jgi:hypothetical protein
MKKSITLVAIAVLYLGCGQRAGKEWIPSAVGGPLQIRPMPLPSQLEGDYRQWVEQSDKPTVRLYAVTLTNSEGQTGLVAEATRQDTPLGRPFATQIRFRYAFSTNEAAYFEFLLQGKHNPAFFRVSTNGLTFLAMPARLKGVREPILKIVASTLNRSPRPSHRTNR